MSSPCGICTKPVVDLDLWVFLEGWYGGGGFADLSDMCAGSFNLLLERFELPRVCTSVLRLC